MINSFVDVWAAFALVLMLPLVLVTWLSAYDDLKKRWGKKHGA